MVGNLFIWFGLFLVAYFTALFVSKGYKATVGGVFISALVGALIRLLQFILMLLFKWWTPASYAPQLVFGLFITAIMLLGFFAIPFVAHSRDEKFKARVVGYGMFLYLGYFLAGTVISYFFGILPSFSF